MDALTLNTLLDDLLADCNDAYTNVTGAPTAPARQYVSHGLPVWAPDCDHLAVWVSGLRIVSPFPLTQLRAIEAADLPTADLTIEVVRACWPVLNPITPANVEMPSPAELTAAAKIVALDASTLMSYIGSLAASGGLFPSFPTMSNSDISLQPMTVLGPQGAHAGWRWPISVKLAIP